MTRIQVHPDEMIKNAVLISESKHQLGKIFYELEKTMHFLQSDWSGMTREDFFRDFREVKEYIFPSFLDLLSTFQKKLQEEARAFRAVDSSTGEVRIIPSPPEPSFLMGLIDKAIGDTVIGLSDTIVSFFNNPLSTLGDVGYDLTIGKIVDVGRGIGFAWDAAWGTGTAKSDIEEFVNEQKKQLEEDESGYYKGAVIGKAASYFLFGKALHSKNHNGSGGSNGSNGSGDSKKEPEKGSGKEGTGNVFENGRASIETFKSNPKVFSGKSAEEIAKTLEDAGYEVTVQASKKSRSGAKIIKILNTEGDKNITQMQVSPGGGRHGESPYVKISTSDQGIIKIVDGSENVYKTDGAETATIIFTGRK
ncbi:MAG: WXG100 family type VII secretion target [Paenibacillus sp.]|uniref:WXG100 family type VII secretion target n=1 Tax=Paenibacillus sp. TaxID=58172 RepID=UPI0025D81D9B|nr:WXG100 family type VII secretion target [Paenibacillus sp.]MBR2564889.1 WXG100 family type VII secretion target [Paenibacillus sp.]